MDAVTRSVARGESDELLTLAQEAGRVGIFEWQVQAGTVRLSPTFLALYGLTEFDRRYEELDCDCIFREDQPRIAHLIENAFAEQGARAARRISHRHPDDGQLKWMEARSLIFYDARGVPFGSSASTST